MESETTEEPTFMRLPINLGTDLQVDIEGTEIRFKSKLVGVEPNQFLLIKLPVSDDAVDQITKNPVVVRYIYKGSIFGFRTTYINSASDPFHLAFIKYPDEFENYELRAQSRYECFLPIRVKIKESEKSGALLDISEEGIRIAIRDRGYAPSFLQLEDPVSVFIRFPQSPTEEEFFTEVRRISNEAGRVVLGLGFSELDLSKKSLIAKFIAELREFN